MCPVCCTQDEGTFHLKDAAKNLLKGLGSQVAATLSWRDMWTLVVKKGGRDLLTVCNTQTQSCGFASLLCLIMCTVGAKCLESTTKNFGGKKCVNTLC